MMLKINKELDQIEESETIAGMAENHSPYTMADAFVFLTLFKAVLTILLNLVKLFAKEKTDREIDKFLEFLNK